jgi:hypothetical protein
VLVLKLCMIHKVRLEMAFMKTGIGCDVDTTDGKDL